MIIQINHSCSICTAGKDRAGLLAALMFGVIGTPVNQINREYTLTQIGIDVIRPLLLRQLGGGREMNLNELTGRRKAYAEVL